MPDKYDVTCLNHQRCRELFTLQEYSDLCENSEESILLNVNALSEYAREFLESYSLDHWIPELVNLYENIQQKPVVLVEYPSDRMLEIVIDDNDNNDEDDIIIID